LADNVSDSPTAKPSQVAIDETAVKITGEWSWVYAAIDIDSRLILDVAVFGRRGTDPAAAFLHRLTQKHDLSETVFLVDGYGYLTTPSRLGLSG
jgi:transposase-like protein